MCKTTPRGSIATVTSPRRDDDADADAPGGGGGATARNTTACLAIAAAGVCSSLHSMNLVTHAWWWTCEHAKACKKVSDCTHNIALRRGEGTPIKDARTRRSRGHHNERHNHRHVQVGGWGSLRRWVHEQRRGWPQFQRQSHPTHPCSPSASGRNDRGVIDRCLPSVALDAVGVGFRLERVAVGGQTTPCVS